MPARASTRLLGALALALFATQFVALEATARARPRLDPRHLALAAASVVAWVTLAAARTPAWARAATALVAALIAASQAAFVQRYGATYDLDTARVGLRAWGDVWPVLALEAPRLAPLLALAIALEFALLRVAPRVVRPRWAALAAAAFGCAALLGPRAAAPDVAALSSLRALLEPRARRAPGARVELPPARAHDAPPSVVLVVTESVRADAYCSSFDPACTSSPAVNALFPERVGLAQLRSLASFTVLSMATLTTGHPQAIARDDLLRLPTVFDHLAAARAGDRRIYTAYWSGHNHPMFERENVRDAVDSYLTAEDFVGDQEWHDDTDDRVLAHFARQITRAPRPFFVLLHLVGTHTPYAFDPADAPFAPHGRDFSWSGLPALRNTYRNAIHRQDALLARALSTLSGEPPTLVVFTSDHGEEFGEHRQIHHGQDVLDSQVHVPGFVAELGDALTPAQRAHLRAAAPAFVTHADVLPTVLDAFGVLDARGPLRDPLPGRSLLRPLEPAAPLPMTNCSEAFPCPFRAWGVIAGDHRLEAQQWDPGWNCWRLAPTEALADPDHPACVALRTASQRWFAETPGGAPNR